MDGKKKIVKKVVSILLALTMVITSISYVPKTVSAVDWSNTSGWDTVTVGGIAYKLKAETGWVQGFATHGAATGYMKGDALWCNFKDAVYTKAVINGVTYESDNYKGASDTVRFDGAQMWWMPSLCTTEQTTIQFYNGNILQDTVYVYNSNTSGGAGSSGGSGTSGNGGNIEEGRELIPDNWQNGTRNVDAVNSGMVEYTFEYKIENLTVTQNRWYVAKYTVTSNVRKAFQLRLQDASNGYWDITGSNNNFPEVIVEAGKTESITYMFKSNSSTSGAIMDVCMGYISGVASAAANVTFSNVSLKEYSSSEAAEQGQNSSGSSDPNAPAAPSKAILYNLTDAGQNFKAVIEDKKNKYEGGVTPSYDLYVNGTLVKTTTSTEVTLTEAELSRAGLQDNSKTNSFYAKVTVNGKTSGNSSTTYFYYKSGTVAKSAYQNEVPKIYVSTSRTLSTQNIDLINGTNKDKVDAGLVVENGGAVEASNFGTIKIRGNSTALAAKKPYNISFNSKVNLFHLSDRADGKSVKGSKKWSLLANIFDKTLLRNQIGMDFQRGLEEDRNPAQAYTSKCMTVDLYVDGKYMGTYTLIESVDTGDDRVDIDDEYVNEDTDEVTTEGTAVAGTNLKIHDMLLELANDLKETGELSDRADTESYYFTTGVGHYFAINSPARNEDLNRPYIPSADINQKPGWVREGKTFVDAFETALNTRQLSQVEKYIDINSFVDFYITSEYFMTKDIGFSSTRFYIKNGKMYAGPLWDLDLSSGNIINGESASGTYAQNEMSWFRSLMNIDEFKAKVKARYTSTKVQKTITALYAAGGTVDQAVAIIRKSVDANYNQAGWRINTNYGAYNSTVTHSTYDEYITDYKNWLSARNEWFLNYLGYDPNVPSDDDIDSDDDSEVLTASENDLSVEGFQIQANDDGKLNGSVNYRTVCKSLKKGSTIKVGNTSYTVESYGVIYARDWKNLTGDHAKDNLKVEHTLLDEKNPVSGKQYSYLGKNAFDGAIVAVGYIASDAAVIDEWDKEDNEHTYYAVTMTNLEGNYMAETNYVRAFIRTTGGKLIYSKITSLTSVAEIASYLYLGKMCKNVSAHQYLYDNILHSAALLNIRNIYGNKFYLDTPVEYAWDDSIYKPGAKLE